LIDHPYFSNPSLRAALHVQRLGRLVAVEGKKFSELSWECVAVTKSIVEAAFLVRRMIAAITDEQDGLRCKGVERRGTSSGDLIHSLFVPFHYIPFNSTNALTP
jgi:hypothetical protein